MQTQTTHYRFKAAQTPPTRHPATDATHAPRALAFAGAVLMTALGMTMLMRNAPAAMPVQHVSNASGQINGIPVFDLPAINVSADVTAPSVDNDVADNTRQTGFAHSLLQRLGTKVDASQAMGTYLAMPYYSLSSQLGHVSKD